MKTKKEKLKQSNLSSKKNKKNRVANQNNKRNKKLKQKKNTMQKNLFCVAKILSLQQKNFFA